MDDPLYEMFEIDVTVGVAEEGTSPSEKARRRHERKKAKHEKQVRRHPKPFEPRTRRQAEYAASILENTLTFGVGPAGVGKTYVPARLFGDQLRERAISKVYAARPNVSKAKHRNGFLPGSADEKSEPWLVPIFEGLKDALGPQEFQRMRRDNTIEIVPFEFIQGRTFKDAGCIVDEAENLDEDDLYITLTRQGEDLSMVLCGDIFQARIPNSGLSTVVQMARAPWMEDTGIIEFGEDDVVRGKQAWQWVKAFADRQRELNLRDASEDGIRHEESFRTDPPAFLRS